MPGIHIDDSAGKSSVKLQNSGRRKATKIKRASAVIIKTREKLLLCGRGGARARQPACEAGAQPGVHTSSWKYIYTGGVLIFRIIFTCGAELCGGPEGISGRAAVISFLCNHRTCFSV